MEKEKKLEYLKQQKENPTGGYRMLLIDTYNCLSDMIKASNEDWCNPYNTEVCKVVYGNTYHVPLIQRYIRDLNQLGCISITGSGSDRKIRILKEIDF